MGNDYNEPKAINQAFAPPKPSLCRMVLYTHRKPSTAVSAAVVTGVYGEATMTANLTVFPDGGAPRPESDVLYDADGKPGTWRWPPRV